MKEFWGDLKACLGQSILPHHCVGKFWLGDVILSLRKISLKQYYYTFVHQCIDRITEDGLQIFSKHHELSWQESNNSVDTLCLKITVFCKVCNSRNQMALVRVKALLCNLKDHSLQDHLCTKTISNKDQDVGTLEILLMRVHFPLYYTCTCMAEILQQTN